MEPSPWVRWFCIVEKEKKRLVPHNRCVEFRNALCESYSESIPPHHCANRFHLITVEGSDGEDGPVMEYLKSVWNVVLTDVVIQDTQPHIVSVFGNQAIGACLLAPRSPVPRLLVGLRNRTHG